MRITLSRIRWSHPDNHAAIGFIEGMMTTSWSAYGRANKMSSTVLRGLPRSSMRISHRAVRYSRAVR